MKKIILPLVCSFYIAAKAQSYYPALVDIPVTGFEQLQADNSYIRGSVPNDSVPGQWTPQTRFIRQQAPNINKTGLNIASSWENNTWVDNQYTNDSFILDAQNRIKTVFERSDYNYPTYVSHTKSKYEFHYNTLDQISQLEYFETPNETSNVYKRQSNIYFSYGTNGERIKDSSIYTYSGSAQIMLSHYQYEGNKLVLSAQLNGPDTTSKIEYTYSGDNLVSNRNYSFDPDADDWSLTYSDTFEYDGDNRVSSRKTSGFMFIDGNISFGPFRNDSYMYTSDGQLSEMTEHTWYNNEWRESTKTVVAYTGEHAEVAYQYPADGNGGWSSVPEYQYLFHFPTGLNTIGKASAAFILYPNPASDLLQIDLKDPSGSIELYDANGKLMYVNTDPTVNQKIQVSDYPNGMYYLRYRAKAKSGNVTQQKLMIRH